ncbi:MAG: DUF4433 domain-containing protein [Planctomycetes bacterium]|nr:DUF4433 domain-containing protein [Planctomycetota bacterium]
MIPRKSDAAQIIERLRALTQSPWLGPSRHWWPQFVFHFTDIQNVVSILSLGRLLPRSRCPSRVEIASVQVIDTTDDTWKDYVRLYFRPRTPTQYHNEGIRPAGRLTSLEAHCPVPVFLAFDAVEVLTRATTRFSEGSVAAASSVGEDSRYFAAIPFEKVYHDSPLSEAEKRNIIFHRHAEVLIPDELDLSALKYVVCRSEAESETLRNLLPANVRDEFEDRIRGGRRGNLFFRRWTFVESASLAQNSVTFRFNPSTQTPGPFVAQLCVTDLDNGKVYTWKDSSYSAHRLLTVNVPQFTGPTPYEVRLTFDDCAAYVGRRITDEILF